MALLWCDCLDDLPNHRCGNLCHVHRALSTLERQRWRQSWLLRRHSHGSLPQRGLFCYLEYLAHRYGHTSLHIPQQAAERTHGTYLGSENAGGCLCHLHRLLLDEDPLRYHGRSESLVHEPIFWSMSAAHLGLFADLPHVRLPLPKLKVVAE